MGICISTGKHRLINDRDIEISSPAFGSWPKNLNDSQRYLRTYQSRTMSEPIMVINGRQNRENGVTVESSSSGPGPPKIIPLSFTHKTTTVDIQDIPDVPCIFVLGGPGSGKITHCEQIAREIEGLLHLNMQTNLITLAAEIGSRDPNIVPAYKALEILTTDLLSTKNATALLITGYPRNMRDVVEYMARIQRVDGVILLDWSDRSLQRQIQLGAKMGDIDMNLARFEMNNYRSNVIPVAQFFDQQGLLHIVAGQRAPIEIYDDLKEEVMGILSQFEVESATPVASELKETTQMDTDEASITDQQTKVVVHIPTENSGKGKRKESIDSVDLMIAEEMQHVMLKEQRSDGQLPSIDETEDKNVN